MLYTVRPLERVYAQPGIFDLQKEQKPKEAKDTEAEYKEVILPSGRIMTRRDGENYVIEHISSTDMQDYLNEEYAPGKNYIKRNEK